MPRGYPSVPPQPRMETHMETYRIELLFQETHTLSHLPSAITGDVLEDQTYQGRKTQCDPVLQVKAPYGSMGQQIYAFQQIREVE
ncbi:hypothetical protein WISP_112180 [Willisornis vidua]|uniref:Uncharacterized protein n=1 Tax=Willisornis vidua TaxID=1566151 RepID=A0ABQ9CV66_9PASS|nr:hypothetical protein WISP_112180 [Willisornis vidua]